MGDVTNITMKLAGSSYYFRNYLTPYENQIFPKMEYFHHILVGALTTYKLDFKIYCEGLSLVLAYNTFITNEILLVNLYSILISIEMLDLATISDFFLVRYLHQEIIQYEKQHFILSTCP